MTLEQKIQKLQGMTMYCWGDEFMLALEVINELVEQLNKQEDKNNDRNSSL